MPTENTTLKNTTPAGDSNTTNEMDIGKINTYQRTFLIVASSLLAVFVLIAVAGKLGGQHLQSSVNGIAEGAGSLADYQVDSVNLALTKDIFGLGSVSEKELQCGHCSGCNVNDPSIFTRGGCPRVCSCCCMMGGCGWCGCGHGGTSSCGGFFS